MRCEEVLALLCLSLVAAILVNLPRIYDKAIPFLTGW